MDGLWSVLFSTPFGSGFGVAVFTKGEIVGGDSQFYWFGTYSVIDNKIQAELRGYSHSGGAVPSVLGGSRSEFSIQLIGTISGLGDDTVSMPLERPNLTP